MYISNVLGMLREHRRFFLWIGLAGLALRLFFFIYFAATTDDSHVYIDLASNWLQHGIYGQTEDGRIVPSDTRLPGYPAFLAAMFWVFGLGSTHAVLVAQILFDLGTALLIADLARRMVAGRWAGRVAFLLAALCPFFANYAAAVLTETLEVFFTVLALDCAVAALDRTRASQKDPLEASAGIPWPLWAATGAAIGASILLRPDGGILLAATLLYVAVGLRAGSALVKRRPGTNLETQRAAPGAPIPGKRVHFFRTLLVAEIIVIIIALAPLAPWTVRNWTTLHQFQPLAPRYATESEEVVPVGFNRWVRTWMADYVSVEEIYWNVPGDKIDVEKLPARALDSAKDATLALIADYNVDQRLTPQIDARFDQVAEQRIRAHPFRYYVELPLARIADMWLRPRTELLPSDPRWWEFNDDPKWSAAAVAFGVINLVFVVAAGLGLIFRRADVRYIGLLVCFVVLRSAFLGSLENPETRYTLECYPAIIVLGSAWISGWIERRAQAAIIARAG
ncbi:MAG: glycosyltransferase family 39 protein [Terriglobales bacterium]